VKDSQLWLDFFGVIVPNHRCVVQNLANRTAYSEQIIIDKVFRSSEYQSLFVGSINLDEFARFCSNSLDLILTKEDLLKIWAEEILALQNEVAQLLNWAKSVFTQIILISDTHALYWHTIQERGIDEKFSNIFASHISGTRKIDGKLYQVALKETNAIASSVIIVDDRAGNIVHASSLGMKTIMYNIDQTPVTILKQKIQNFIG
jgi:HAD superfamily hydrolase (TIGR01509 family)